jgi:HEXXH motif-containing protein
VVLEPRWFGHFACPQEPGDPCVLDAVAVPHARTVASRLAGSIPDDGGLAPFIDAWAAQSDAACKFDDVWDIAFGRAHSALTATQGDKVSAAVRVGVRLIEMGMPGSWQAVGVGVGRLRLGKMLLPEAEAIEASRSGTCADLTLKLPGGNHVRATQKGRDDWQVDGAEPIANFDAGRVVRLLPRRAVSQDAEGFDGVSPIEAVDTAMESVFAAGARILAAHAPDTLDWVSRVLRDVVVCVPEAAFRAVSGSGEQAPGIIHVSYPLGRMDIAEILIHECAHQYFYLLERLGPLDDGSDSRLYWSPPIRRERPLSRILMAYHALANVRLFYEGFRVMGYESEAQDGPAYVARNLSGLDAAIAELDVPLRASAAFTCLGRALHEPLQKRIAELT